VIKRKPQTAAVVWGWWRITGLVDFVIRGNYEKTKNHFLKLLTEFATSKPDDIPKTKTLKATIDLFPNNLQQTQSPHSK
jgi:hypothetical protein